MSCPGPGVDYLHLGINLSLLLLWSNPDTIGDYVREAEPPGSKLQYKQHNEFEVLLILTTPEPEGGVDLAPIRTTDISSGSPTLYHLS